MRYKLIGSTRSGIATQNLERNYNEQRAEQILQSLFWLYGCSCAFVFQKHFDQQSLDSLKP